MPAARGADAAIIESRADGAQGRGAALPDRANDGEEAVRELLRICSWTLLPTPGFADIRGIAEPDAGGLLCGQGCSGALGDQPAFLLSQRAASCGAAYAVPSAGEAFVLIPATVLSCVTGRTRGPY